MLPQSLSAVLVAIALITQVNQAEEFNQFEPQDGTARINLPGNLVGRLANITDQANVWVLVPSSANATNFQFGDGEYNLFKLDTSSLVYGAQRYDSLARTVLDDDSLEPETGRRGARKINFFKNVLNKPKVSPLYLVNGTVCRFVNSQPICTTLSTTGLIRNQNQFANNQQQGFFNQQQQQQQFNNNNNNLQQGARQIPFNQFGGQNQQQFPQQQQQQFNPQNNGNFQQFRPAAIVDDETIDINVAASNSTDGSTKVVRGQGANKVQTMTVQATRPVSFVVSRRPLNLLAFGRPLRQYQVASRRSLATN